MRSLEQKVIRGSIFYFDDQTTLKNLSEKLSFNSHKKHYHYFEDGLLIIKNGKVASAGEYKKTIKNVENPNQIIHYKNCLITPGFIDTHIHATQSLAVAAHGMQLMDWLENYIFPCEIKFSDPAYAQKNLTLFFDLMLRNGTTTAAVYAPAQYEACNIFFELAEQLNMRLIAGKVMMDRNGPAELISPAQKNYNETKNLIQKWHQKSRINYAITPRFAIACSDELLKSCGDLAKEFPETYIQTHIYENPKEVEEVKRLFPWSKNYLDVYDYYELVNERTLLAHCIHCNDSIIQALTNKKSMICWCPISNYFLGSGLFPIKKFIQYTNNIGLATDWGAGNTACMLKAMEDSYKMSMQQHHALSSLQSWYLATLGAAQSLKLDQYIGNFATGKEADFIIIDPHAIPELSHRMQTIKDIEELLFALMMLGDSRIIKKTYIKGVSYDL